MRKIVLFVCVLFVTLGSIGCNKGAEMTNEEKNAPAPPGPHGNSAGQPNSMPHGSPSGSAGH